jgi:hypothetical protein
MKAKRKQNERETKGKPATRKQSAKRCPSRDRNKPERQIGECEECEECEKREQQGT